jgi:hypothetical protein
MSQLGNCVCEDTSRSTSEFADYCTIIVTTMFVGRLASFGEIAPLLPVVCAVIPVG